MLRVIGKSAFRSCTSLKNAKFSQNLKEICLFAFFGSGLEKAELPASLRTVAQGAFAECKSLRAVTFSKGLQILGTDECSDEDG